MAGQSKRRSDVNHIQRVFLSAPLSALSREIDAELSTFSKSLAHICQQHGLKVFEPDVRANHQMWDSFRPDKVYEENRGNLIACDLVVAYVGLASAGVGMEIEIANSQNIPVIVLYESSRQEAVSRLVLGCPVVRDSIVAPTLDAIAEKLHQKLGGILKRLEVEITPPDASPFIDLLKRTHDRSTLSLSYVARAATLDKGYLSRLLSGKIPNPGRDQIVRLCAWGWKISLEETNSILRLGGYATL